jgi:hypothetical protein
VKGAFAFDVFTSIPVSFVELSVKMACDRAAAAGLGFRVLGFREIIQGWVSEVGT